MDDFAIMVRLRWVGGWVGAVFSGDWSAIIMRHAFTKFTPRALVL